jgi:predicted dehydrogenase
LILAVTYNYSGHPMIRLAKEMVEDGEIGEIRVIQCEYAQDWLAEPIEKEGHKQALWRTDPLQSGLGGCIGDIGTHAFHLACFVSGLEPEALCADISRFGDGRKLDDNANVLLRFKGNARGIIWASQVAIGNENNLKLRIFGNQGGLSWRQEEPNELILSPLNQPSRRITRDSSSVANGASLVSSVPAGHPEGYLEGFTTIYSEIGNSIIAARNGEVVDQNVSFPTAKDGKAGVKFIETVVRSSNEGSVWINL